MVEEESVSIRKYFRTGRGEDEVESRGARSSCKAVCRSSQVRLFDTNLPTPG
jgi:hypothetical protein